jgi:integrase
VGEGSESRSGHGTGPTSYLEKYGAHHSGALALTVEEATKLLGAVDNTRDSALLALAISTGIRREDVVAIRLGDVDAERGSVTFYESKKRRTRTVPIDGGGLRALRQYVHGIPRGQVWLFPGGHGNRPRTVPGRPTPKHLTGRAAWNVLNHWLRVAGLEPRPFHALRSTCYKMAKARGWSPEQAAALIGDSVRVAMEVYGVSTPGELKEAARDRPILT